MQKFIKKLIERLEELRKRNSEIEGQDSQSRSKAYANAISIVNQLAEEYNNDFCEWNYSCFDEYLIKPFHHKGAVGMYKECLKNNPFAVVVVRKSKLHLIRKESRYGVYDSRRTFFME